MDHLAPDYEVRYARKSGTNVAYMSAGSGDLDLVSLANWASHVDAWCVPGSPLNGYFRCAVELGRVLSFDRRGTGASDPPPSSSHFSIGEWMDDLDLVLEDANVRKPFVVVANGQGAQLALLYAATRPDDCRGLVVVDGFARLSAAPDYPFGLPPDRQERIVQGLGDNWGTGSSLELVVPLRRHDPATRRWIEMFERMAASPATAQLMQRIIYSTDIRHVLSQVRTPTLCVHNCRSRMIPIEHGRYLAAHIPGSCLIEVDHEGEWWLSEFAEDLFENVHRFVLGTGRPVREERQLATVVFTDIVGSTDSAARLGDARWRAVLDQHDSIGRELTGRYGGRLVKSTGDGQLVTFDGPTRALRYASAFSQALSPLDIQIRVGVHTGEIELRGEDIGGLAVHIAARVSALATGGSVVATRTVKDLTAGSEFRFQDNGAHTLRGVPEEWQLYLVHEANGRDLSAGQ